MTDEQFQRFDHLHENGCGECGTSKFELCPPCAVEYARRFGEVPDIFSPVALANQSRGVVEEDGKILMASSPLEDFRKLREEMVPGHSVDKLYCSPEIAQLIEEAKEHCRLMRTSPVYFVRYYATVASIRLVRALRWILRRGRD